VVVALKNWKATTTYTYVIRRDICEIFTIVRVVHCLIHLARMIDLEFRINITSVFHVLIAFPS